jgi:thiamine pyrophosphokinase
MGKRNKQKLQELFKTKQYDKTKYHIDLELLANTALKNFDKLGWDGINYLAQIVSKKRNYPHKKFIAELGSMVKFRNMLYGQGNV